MISAHNYKIIKIDITTYKRQQDYTKTMNEEKCNGRYCRETQNRFICSICLNKKPDIEEERNIECYKRKSKSCPVCQRSYDVNEYAESIVKKESSIYTKHHENQDKIETKTCNKMRNCGKKMQTSQPDVTKGLTLLNEVLTVFQSKKLDAKNENKTIIFKDASVSTDNTLTKYFKPNLTLSKVFQYSIEENIKNTENFKFTILNYEPEKKTKSTIDLIKHKSSSIPQMKLEELKKSLKVKTKSKDAIEEVNRMFATVRKTDTCDSLDKCNRPMIRNGPRVLPVVKANYIEGENVQDEMCICCHYLSGGDSVVKQDCMHKNDHRCDECFRTPCCHHFQHRTLPSNVCELCRSHCKTDRY